MRWRDKNLSLQKNETFIIHVATRSRWWSVWSDRGCRTSQKGFCSSETWCWDMQPRYFRMLKTPLQTVKAPVIKVIFCCDLATLRLNQESPDLLRCFPQVVSCLTRCRKLLKLMMFGALFKLQNRRDESATTFLFFFAERARQRCFLKAIKVFLNIKALSICVQCGFNTNTGLVTAAW